MFCATVFLTALCIVGEYNETSRPEFREGARVFVSEFFETGEPSDAAAAEILQALLIEAVERYAFWRAQNIAYHQAPPALATGRANEAQVCRAVRELIGTACKDPDTKNRRTFAMTVLSERCPAPRAAR